MEWNKISIAWKIHSTSLAVQYSRQYYKYGYSFYDIFKEQRYKSMTGVFINQEV